MSLIALVCPHCAVDLAPPDGARLFGCHSCGRSWQSGGPLGLRPLRRSLWLPTRPVPEVGKIVSLPIWVLPLAETTVAASLDRLPTEIRLPAVGLDRPSLLLRWARNLSRAGGTPQRVDPSPLRATSGELVVEDSFELAEVLLLGLVDGWPPDSEVESFEAGFGTPELVDLPCVVAGGELHDLVFGLAVPAVVVDLDALFDQRSTLPSDLIAR